MSIGPRVFASACLSALLIGGGVALAYLCRENSMVLLRYTAFVALVAPLLAALPSALLYQRSRAVFAAIVCPVVVFALSKILFRLLGFSGERLIALIIIFAIAILESAAIAWPVARLHASVRVFARRLPLITSLYSATAGNFFAWLALRYPLRLPPYTLWFVCFCLASSFAVSLYSFVPVRRAPTQSGSPAGG
jgi:hypothetical protein